MSIALFPGRHHLDRRAEALIEEANRGTDDELIDTARIAVWLGVSTQWLEIGRCRGWGPPFIKLSPRRVRYRVGTVKAWLEERAHRCTAEYAHPAAPRQGRKPGALIIEGKVVPPDQTGRSERVRLDDDPPGPEAA